MRARLEALFGIDVRTLAALRIALASLLLIDLLSRLPEVAVFYSDAGLLPRTVVLHQLDNPWKWSIHLMSGTWQVQAGLLLLGGWFALSLLLGWRTRSSTAISWLLLASLHVRNPIVLTGGDVILRLALFWGIFLSWGARWSLDARRHPAPTATVLSPATVAFLGQVAIVYLASAAEKIQPEWRTEGSAIYYALSNHFFASALGRELLRFPMLMRTLTPGVVWFEALGPLLLFSPLATAAVRSVVLPMFWLLHTAFGLTLELQRFPWICSAAMLAFVPGRWWDVVGASARRHRVANASHGTRWAVAWWDVVERAMQPSRAASAPEPAAGRAAHPARARNAPSLATHALVAVLAAYVLWWNLDRLPGSWIHLPASLKPPAYLLRLDQSWRMFAPPPKGNGWYVIPGRLHNGQVVDLFTGGQPVTWDKPALSSRAYRNASWRMHMRKLVDKERWLPPCLARYLCRTWNARHPASERVEELEIVFISEPTPPEGQPATFTRFPILKESCAEQEGAHVR